MGWELAHGMPRRFAWCSPQLSHPQTQPIAIYWRRMGFRFLYPRQVQKAAFKNLQPFMVVFCSSIHQCCIWLFLTYVFILLFLISHAVLYSRFSFIPFLLCFYLFLFFPLYLRPTLSIHLRKIPKEYVFFCCGAATQRGSWLPHS